MRRPGSLDLKEPEVSATARQGSIAAAAAAGKSLEALLELAARALLLTEKASRVAVWVETSESDPVWQGAAVSTEPAYRSSATYLDISSLPRHLLSELEPICWEARITPPSQLANLFAGMRSVMWLPLFVGSAFVGVALIAFADHVAPEDPDRLKGIVAELSLAVGAFRERQRLERAHEEFAAWTGLHRAILRGAAAGQILEGIASAAVPHAQAEFVAIGGFAGKEMIWQALAGRPECAALLHSTLARDLVQSAQAKGGPVLRSLSTSEAEPRAEAVAGFPTVYSLIALPLQGEKVLTGMLLAGFAPGQKAGERRLEPYAALASAALAGEGKSAKAADFESAFAALFEDCTEALLVVNSNGLIQRANRRARELLVLKEMGPKEVTLLELFSASARDAVSLWLQGATGELIPRPLEAPLQAGFVVRLHRRSSFGASKGLVLYVEEGSLAQRAEQKWKQVEAELHSVLDAVEAGILLLNLAGRIRFTNARFAVLFGLEERRLSQLQDFEELVALVQENFQDPQAFAER